MSEIVKVNADEFGLEETTASQIAAQFKPMLEKMEQLEVEFNRIVSLPSDDPNSVKEARELRLKYVKVRTGTAEIHKQQKAFYLAGGRYVDGWKNAQLFASQGKEEKLEAIEKYAENLEKERQQKLIEERSPIIVHYGQNAGMFDLGNMPQEQFDLMVAGMKQAHEAKLEAERKAEEERIAREKAETEERERIRIENERLRKEAEQREAALKAEREAAERKLAEERAAAERARKEAEEAARKEREALEAQMAEERRIAEEKAAKERAEAEAKAAVERAERERVEAELRARKEAESKAEAEKLAAIEAEANKGDAAKVKDLIADLQAIGEKYSFKSKKNQQMYADVKVLISKIVTHIEK
jgi:hypothetical protein